MPESARWHAACEPLLPGVPRPLQAHWWREYARHQLIHGQPGAAVAARRAAALYRELGDGKGLFWSLVPLVRSLKLPCDDLDALCDEIRAYVQTLPEGSHREQALAAGTLAVACQVRGDWAGTLAGRESEAEHMRRFGDRVAAATVDCNIVHAKLHGGRPKEAVDDARALLALPEGSVPGVEVYARLFLLAALLQLGRLEEAHAEAAPALALCRRLEMPHATDQVALLAALQGRPHTAARLLGHARQTYRRLGTPLPTTDDPPYPRAEALVRAALPAALVERLIVEGESLDAEAAERLLFAGTDSD